jgi:hypothetical protein
LKTENLLARIWNSHWLAMQQCREDEERGHVNYEELYRLADEKGYAPAMHMLGLFFAGEGKKIGPWKCFVYGFFIRK